MRYLFTDDLWAAFGTLARQAKTNRQGPAPTLPERQFFEALLYLCRTGVPWRDLPGEFGAWDAVYNRFRRWVGSGALRRLFELLTADRRPRAGRRAAGVRRLDHRPRPPARGRGPAQKKRLGAERSQAAQALGRSRGGLSTKVVVAVSDEHTVLAVDVVPGQANDLPRLLPVLDRARGRAPAVDQVVADRGFDGDELRAECLGRDVGPHIPIKSNRDPERWECERAAYRERNRVERLFGRAKEFRRIATRYDKLKATYLGLLHLVFGFIRLRGKASVNTA